MARVNRTKRVPASVIFGTACMILAAVAGAVAVAYFISRARRTTPTSINVIGRESPEPSAVPSSQAPSEPSGSATPASIDTSGTSNPGTAAAGQ
ncbi:MAG: hypothetical protein ACLQVD_17415 [Capsulimonadaceae bacterium]